MEIKNPKPKEDVIKEIEELLHVGKPDELLKYVSENPGFAWGYVDMIVTEIELKLTAVRLIMINLAKAQTDIIMKNSRSSEGGIPVDLSSLQ